MQGEECQFLLWQLLRGVEHVHRRVVPHRDNKPPHILARCPPLVGRAPAPRELAGQGAFLDDAGWGQDRGKRWRLSCLVSQLRRLGLVTQIAVAWSCEVCVCVDERFRARSVSDDGLLNCVPFA